MLTLPRTDLLMCASVCKWNKPQTRINLKDNIIALAHDNLQLLRWKTEHTFFFLFFKKRHLLLFSQLIKRHVLISRYNEINETRKIYIVIFFVCLYNTQTLK